MFVKRIHQSLDSLQLTLRERVSRRIPKAVAPHMRDRDVASTWLMPKNAKLESGRYTMPPPDNERCSSFAKNLCYVLGRHFDMFTLAGISDVFRLV